MSNAKAIYPPSGDSAVNNPVRELTVKLTLDASEFESSLKELSKVIEDISKGITCCFSQQMNDLAEDLKKISDVLSKDISKDIAKPNVGCVTGYDGYSIDVRTQEEIKPILNNKEILYRLAKGSRVEAIRILHKVGCIDENEVRVLHTTKEVGIEYSAIIKRATEEQLAAMSKEMGIDE